MAKNPSFFPFHSCDLGLDLAWPHHARILVEVKNHFCCFQQSCLFICQSPKIEIKLDIKTGNVTQQCTVVDNLQLLLRPDTHWRVFPNARICCGCEYLVHRLTEPNFSLILRDAARTTTTLTRDGDCYSMCFGYGHDAHVGFIYVIFCYTSNVDDVSDIANHVSLQLPTAVQICTRAPLHVIVNLPGSTNSTKAFDVLKTVKGLTVTPKQLYSTTTTITECARLTNAKL